MNAEPQAEHRWLQELVGEWSYESECEMDPGKPSMKVTGTQVTRSLGGLWILCEAEGEVPGGGRSQSIITLGYDPRKGRFVGTFIASMMAELWPYEGTLDTAANRLVLDSEGPSFTGPGMAKYQDILEVIDRDHHVLRAQVLGEDGQWHPMMIAHYHRTR